MRESGAENLATEFVRIFRPTPPRPLRRSQARAYVQWRSAVRSRQAERRGGLGDGQPGEVAELDQLGLERVLGRQPGQGLVQGEQIFAAAPGRRPGPASSSTSVPAAAVLGRPPSGGRASTRMRRMASAAAAKKWPRLSQRACVGRVRRAAGTPRGRGRSRSGCCRGPPRPSGRPPVSATRRTPTAATARRRGRRPVRGRTGCWVTSFIAHQKARARCGKLRLPSSGRFGNGIALFRVEPVERARSIPSHGDYR